MQKVKLKEVCTLINGRAYKQEELLDSGKYPVLRVGNFFSDKDYYYSDLELEEDKYCDSGDLLFAWSASFGPKIWNGGKVIYHYHIWKMVLEDTVNKEYLYYYLYYLSERIKAEGHGGIMIHTTKAEMEERELSLPDVSKQCEIAKVLNQLSAIIEKRQTEIKELDNLIKARFVELFGSINDNKFDYDVMTLQDVCEPIKDGTHQTPTYTEDTINGYKFLSSKDVTSGKVDWTHLKYIPEELHNELYKRISPRKGDVLLAKNGTTGVAAIVDKDEVFDIYVSLALLRPLGLVTSEYLCSAVNSVETKQQFDSSLKGIGVPNLHLGEIKKTKIVVPPIEEQEKFADFVKQVDKSKVAVQKALDEAQLLFDSLMQEYFG